MKESRFIALLNLYVDQELSPDEAAELETEIAGNPARYRTYQQYCRMHRGCALIFERMRAQAPEYAELTKAGREVERKVTELPAAFSARSQSRARLYWAGGLATAAAAVFAVGLVLREPTALPVLSTEAMQVAEAVPAGAEDSREAPVEARAVSNYPVAALLSRNDDSAEAFAHFDRINFDWMNRMELSTMSRLSGEDRHFGADRPAPSRPASRQSHSATFTPGEAFNAFEFRR